MNMVDVHLSYDADLVCSICKTNDTIHYNHFIFHGKNYAHADPDIDVWCDACSGQCDLIEPEEEDEDES